MAIRIVKKLQATPSPTTLPRRIHFVQSLVSNRPTERVRVIYAVDRNQTAIRFADSQGQPTEATERSVTVTNVAAAREHRIKMMGQPSGSFENVEVRQTLIPETGSPKGDLVIVTIRR